MQLRDGRDNNYDFIRLIAASLVIVGHCFVLTNHGPAPRIGGVWIHTLAVDIFFVASGALITSSWIRDASVLRFFARRTLRIFPALVAVVLATALVIGPILTKVPVTEYFGSARTWQYLQNISLLAVYQLPGVFTTGHWTSAVNGSLWTLGLEFASYAAVASSALVSRRKPLIPMLALLLIGAFLAASFGPNDGLGASGRVVAYFALGSIWSTTRLRNLLRPSIVVPVAMLWLAIGLWARPWSEVSSLLLFPPLVLFVAAASTPIARRASRFGDLSYGMYLWGFLVEQIYIEHLGNLQPFVMSILVLVTSAAIAFGSWHLVEKRSLRLKPAPPRRVPLAA